MNNKHLTNDELISAVRGLNIKELSIKDLEFLTGLFKLKSKQIEEEIRKRKAEGKD